MPTLGIDIGGTFTDITLADIADDEIIVNKELTTEEEPANGALEGARKVLDEAGSGFEEVDTLIHGTTLVSNTLIEKTGATTGLLTTKGMGDILRIRRGDRYDVWDLDIEFPDPIVPRNRCLEVDERIDDEGTIVDPLDMESVAEAVDQLVEKHDVDSITVSLLHSYINGEHERRIKDYIQETFPSIKVSLSSEIAPLIREYERTSTTAINAYVQPVVQNHLEVLTTKLGSKGFDGSVYMMTSNGGIIDSETAEAKPVLLIESGPAAGVLISQIFGEEQNSENVFSFDMGGTTAKGSIIEEGNIYSTDMADIARVHRFKEGSGYPVSTPMIDITEIGAGGGSIASVTDLGLLEVGPESAGSDPGPVCYDQGGQEPTVTDAALLLGYLDPDTFFGGRMKLAEDAARDAVHEQLAEPLGVTAQEAAQQVFELVTENMANAFHKHAVSQGADPRNLDMVALGGAGPMHAFRVAEKVGMDEIFCPHGAGVGSAIGLTQAPKLFEATATTQGILATLDAKTMQEQFERLHDRAKDVLLQANTEAEELEASLSLDMRHVNQGKEINVDLPGYEITDVEPELAREYFQETYRKKFNRDTLDFPVEILNYRVELAERRSAEKMGRLASTGQSTDPSSRSVYFGESGKVEADIYDWDSLTGGQTFEGPAIIEANRTTAVADPGSAVRVTDDKDIIMSL